MKKSFVEMSTIHKTSIVFQKKKQQQRNLTHYLDEPVCENVQLRQIVYLQRSLWIDTAKAPAATADANLPVSKLTSFKLKF